MTMLALNLDAPRLLKLVELPVPTPQPGEVLVRVRSVGICGSDLSIYLGAHPQISTPVVMGHEIFGFIESIASDVSGVDVGRPVSVMAGVGCGECLYCNADRMNLCPHMQVIGGHRQGALAEFLTVPASSVVALPEGSEDPLLALVEPAAVAHHAAAKIPSDNLADSVVVIYGLGPVGLLLAQILLARGTRFVYGVDPQRYAREVAERFGVLTTTQQHIERMIISRRTNVDVVFECSGSATALDQGISITRNGGDILLVGIQHEPIAIDWVRVQRYEKNIRGVQMYGRQDFQAVVSLLSEGKITLKHIVSETATLRRTPEMFSVLESGKRQGKRLVTMEGEEG